MWEVGLKPEIKEELRAAYEELYRFSRFRLAPDAAAAGMTVRSSLGASAARVKAHAGAWVGVPQDPPVGASERLVFFFAAPQCDTKRRQEGGASQAS